MGCWVAGCWVAGGWVAGGSVAGGGAAGACCAAGGVACATTSRLASADTHKPHAKAPRTAVRIFKCCSSPIWERAESRQYRSLNHFVVLTELCQILLVAPNYLDLVGGRGRRSQCYRLPRRVANHRRSRGSRDVLIQRSCPDARQIL